MCLLDITITHVANGCNNSHSPPHRHTPFIVSRSFLFVFIAAWSWKSWSWSHCGKEIEQKCVFDWYCDDGYLFYWLWNQSVTVNYQGSGVSGMPRTRFASLMLLLMLLWMRLGPFHLLPWVSLLLTLILVFAWTSLVMMSMMMLMLTRTTMMMLMLLLLSTRTALTMMMMNPCSRTAVTALGLSLSWCHQSDVTMPNTDLSCYWW